MAVTISALVQSILSVTETDSNASPLDNTITYDLSESVTYNASSTFPGTKDVPFVKALSGGAATLDLTAIVHSNGATVDGTGLKVRAAKFENPSTNANAITVTFGASNPYLLLGTGWKIILQPGQSALFNLADGAPAIGSGAKDIDLAGTGSQELSGHLVLG